MRDRPKMSWITPWPGPVGGMRLAGEDDLDRALLVATAARASRSTSVNSSAGALVGREPAREADRQDRRVEDLLELLERRPATRRGARTGCAAGRGRRSRAPASGAGAPPTAPRAGTWSIALPEAALLGHVVHARRGSRSSSARMRSRIGWPTQVGVWTPFVMPRISCGMTPCQVAFAVSRVELAHGVGAAGQAERERGHVERRSVALDAQARAPAPVDRDAARVRAPVALQERGRRPAARGPRRTARCPPRPGCGS